MKSHHLSRRASRRRGPLIDIGLSSLKVFAAGRGMELPLERSATGEPTAAARAEICRELQRFLGKKRRHPRRAACAVPARGVSLRRLVLPATPREETQRALALWVEKEFPLPPEKLAWGYSLHPSTNGVSMAGGSSGQAFTIAALRREVIESYATLLDACGLRPVFSLGALASSRACPSHPGRSALLDIGKLHCELLILENGQATSVRAIAWGGDTVTRRLSEALGLSTAEAEALKLQWQGETPAEQPWEGEAPAEPPWEGEAPAEPLAGHLRPAQRPSISCTIRESLELLARLLRDAWTAAGSSQGGEGHVVGPPATLFLTGGGAKLHGLAPELARGLGGGVACRLLEFESVPGWSAVTAGLAEEEEEAIAGSAALPFLALVSREERRESKARSRGGSLWLWLAVTIFLALASFSLRYVGLTWQLPELRSRLAASTELRKSLPSVDGELNFLEAIDGGQPPYLDLLAAIAQAAPPGTFLEGLSINRQGGITLHGTIASRGGPAPPGAGGGLQAPNDFRNKLVASGFFSQVVLEEQTPTKEENRVAFRLRAQLRAGAGKSTGD